MSRTHTQLTQVVKELRKTEYRPRMTILGSREQLCCNKPKPTSKISSRKSVDEHCDELLEKKGCSYYINVGI
jgi:regulator of telomere elongation helicase 1